MPSRSPSSEALTAASELLGYADAARLLGISVIALRQRVFHSKVPADCIVRDGRRVLFRKSELLRWRARATPGPGGGG